MYSCLAAGIVYLVSGDTEPVYSCLAAGMYSTSVECVTVDIYNIHNKLVILQILSRLFF